MKTPVTHDQMIKMFESQQSAILEITRLNAKAINAKTIQETDRVAFKMDEMIKRQDLMNHSVAENIKAIAINNKTTERVKRISGSFKLYLFGLFGFCYFTAWFYDKIDFLELVLNLIKKV